MGTHCFYLPFIGNFDFHYLVKTLPNFLVLQSSLNHFSGCPDGSAGEEPTCNAGDTGDGVWEDPLEKGMATHFSIFAWRIPWTEEPGGFMRPQSQTQLSDQVPSRAQITSLVRNLEIFFLCA